MCVQQVSVCTPSVAHTEVATTWVRTPVGTTSTTENQKNSSLHDHLERTSSDFLYVLFDFYHQDFVHFFAIQQSSDV